jgi:hypothetical protein
VARLCHYCTILGFTGLIKPTAEPIGTTNNHLGSNELHGTESSRSWSHLTQSINYPPFIRSKGSLPCSQVPAITVPSTLSSPNSLVPPGFPIKILFTSFIPFVIHARPPQAPWFYRSNNIKWLTNYDAPQVYVIFSNLLLLPFLFSSEQFLTGPKVGSPPNTTFAAGLRAAGVST